MYNKIASVYSTLNQFENALEFYMKDISLCQEKYTSDLPSCYNRIGGVLIKPLLNCGGI